MQICYNKPNTFEHSEKIMPDNNIEALKGKKILVTGGAGFIGSHIVDRLAPDNDVTVLDDLSNGTLDYLTQSMSRIKFIKGDILDRALVGKLVNETEYIFHLAARTSIIRSIKEPEADMKINIIGTMNILEASRNAKIKRLVYSSSAAIYGDVQKLPVIEEQALNPRSPYAVSKLAAEKYTLAYGINYGIPTVALRYFNIYGPRQATSEYANVLSIFLNNFKARQPVTIYGDGEQTRDLIFVQDAVAANILAASNPKAVGEVFNIATGKATTVNKVVKIIQQATGWEGQINYTAARPGEILHSRASTKKAERLIGFHPEVTLEHGVKLTWDSLK
jgi:UDP-glucose 4-epimerase